jgi:hypothetical protein
MAPLQPLPRDTLKQELHPLPLVRAQPACEHRVHHHSCCLAAGLGRLPQHQVLDAFRQLLGEGKEGRDVDK